MLIDSNCLVALQTSGGLEAPSAFIKKRIYMSPVASYEWLLETGLMCLCRSNGVEGIWRGACGDREGIDE